MNDYNQKLSEKQRADVQNNSTGLLLPLTLIKTDSGQERKKKNQQSVLLGNAVVEVLNIENFFSCTMKFHQQSFISIQNAWTLVHI